MPPRFGPGVLGTTDPGVDRGVSFRHTEGVYSKRLRTGGVPGSPLVPHTGRVTLRDRTSPKDSRLTLLALQTGRLALQTGRIALQTGRLALQTGRLTLLALQTGRLALQTGRLTLLALQVG